MKSGLPIHSDETIKNQVCAKRVVQPHRSDFRLLSDIEQYMFLARKLFDRIGLDRTYVCA